MPSQDGAGIGLLVGVGVRSVLFRPRVRGRWPVEHLLVKLSVKVNIPGSSEVSFDHSFSRRVHRGWDGAMEFFEVVQQGSLGHAFATETVPPTQMGLTDLSPTAQPTTVGSGLGTAKLPAVQTAGVHQLLGDSVPTQRAVALLRDGNETAHFPPHGTTDSPMLTQELTTHNVGDKRTSRAINVERVEELEE